MTVKYDPDFLQKLKKVDVRVRNHFKKAIAVFTRDPFNPELNNHSLKREYTGYRSIDITNDWRALYAEKTEGDDTVAYFVIFGTHDEFYKRSIN
ncbi:TPA: hypothetical protein DD690_04675 [Candidatus Daviesbacteria bacterium]|nr:MAG: hypothetical protein A3D02_04000 [Candidatus Daviesbacteria bacterium RIFCSPHIGHO2_02_FULL_39_41]OGE68530.1 MAG: hypothetical protein A3H81_02260 [Candidatus Daviesbacteria bacterium RIFCSPLOWO2_02_FULL_38_18]OGE72488.1 MAG: hypothetical protein A3H18_02985 [Candidatus Daviesbacteria bacterium RIFCSPLOWO2_12_FULL_38_10]HBQ51245.1 hypothetical protein [Candidatus Daviesbacteria bacterium]